jgi:hypothetical protein
MLPRQARLRPSFSDCYPRITPGEWHHATWAREIALAQLRTGGPRTQNGGRVLPDAHFEFQGAVGARSTGREPRRMVPPRTDPVEG